MIDSRIDIGRARRVWSRSRLAALFLAATAACHDDDVGPAEPGPTDVPVEPALVTFTDLVNEHRVSVGCAPLTWVSAVADVAQAHSFDMWDRDFFAHVNPDGDSPFDRMQDAGIAFSRAAENIAWGYATPEAVLAGWLDSPGHRTNIENCALTEHGVGLHERYWTHLFRTP